MGQPDTEVRVKFVPEIDEAALLEAVLKVISGHAVVKPGETLVIRIRDWNADQVDCYQEYLDARHQAGEIPFRPLVVIGDELAIVQPEPDLAVVRAEPPDDALSGLAQVLAEQNRKASPGARDKVRL